MTTANYVSSIAALRALGATSPTVAAVRVGSYYGDGKLGGNFFVWNPTSTQADNNGTVIQATGVTTGRWIVESCSVPSIAMFGAKADAVYIDGSANVTGTTLSGGYSYSAADIGKVGTIRGAGTGGTFFNFTITGVSGTSATITPSAPNAVTSKTAIFGTDNWAAIQGAIDWVVYGSIGPNINPYHGNSKVFVDPGSYVVSDVISLGYGEDFSGCVLEGSGPNPFGVGAGPYFYPIFSDRPVFAIQGARGSRIRKIGVQGLNYHYISTNTFLGLGSTLTVDDCVLANWVDPALSANANSRYAPYTCFAIDPYSGTAPTPAYPNVTYPTWYNGGSTTQYNKKFSSDVWFEEVSVIGFVNGLSVVPSDSNGNGDFVRVTQSLFYDCARAVSIGNSQARETILDYCSSANTHTLMATGANGQENGKIGGTILNSSFSTIQVVDLPNYAIAGPVSLEGCYGEACWRIGVATVTGSSAVPFGMHNTEISFEAQTDARGYPADNFNSGNLPAPVTIENCAFVNYNNLMHFNVAPDGFRFVSNYMEQSPVSPLTNAYEYLSYNALCGGFATLPIMPPLDVSVKPVLLYDLDNSYTAAAYNGVVGSTNICERRRCLTPYAKIARPRGLVSSQINAPTGMVEGIGKTGGTITSITLLDKTLTVTFSGRSEEAFQLNGPLPGDLIFDADSRTWFYVRSRSGNTVLADIRNNYRVVGTTRTQPTASYGFNTFSTTSGAFYFLNSRIYTPFYYTQGDLTSGSNSIANVARADTFYSSGIVAVGDYFYLDSTTDLSFNYGTHVGAIAASSPSTFTMNTSTGGSSPANYSQARKPLNYFVRQPPANV